MSTLIKRIIKDLELLLDIARNYETRYPREKLQEIIDYLQEDK